MSTKWHYSTIRMIANCSTLWPFFCFREMLIMQPDQHEKFLDLFYMHLRSWRQENSGRLCERLTCVWGLMKNACMNKCLQFLGIHNRHLSTYLLSTYITLAEMQCWHELAFHMHNKTKISGPVSCSVKTWYLKTWYAMFDNCIGAFANWWVVACSWGSSVVHMKQKSR
jgi:hypothetical protein